MMHMCSRQLTYSGVRVRRKCLRSPLCRNSSTIATCNRHEMLREMPHIKYPICIRIGQLLLIESDQDQDQFVLYHSCTPCMTHDHGTDINCILQLIKLRCHSPVHPQWLLPATSQCGDAWTEPWWLLLGGMWSYSCQWSLPSASW